MVRHILIILISLLFSKQSFSQISKIFNIENSSIDIAIQNTVDSLKEKGVEYFVLQLESKGMLFNQADIRFLLWLENSKVNFQRFAVLHDTGLKIFKSKIIPNGELYNYISNSDTIFHEDIIPFIYKERAGSIESYYPIIEHLHESVTTLIFLTKKQSFIKQIDALFISEKLGGNRININFPYNSNLKLVILYNLIQQVLGQGKL